MARPRYHSKGKYGSCSAGWKNCKKGAHLANNYDADILLYGVDHYMSTDIEDSVSETVEASQKPVDGRSPHAIYSAGNPWPESTVRKKLRYSHCEFMMLSCLH